MRFRKSVKICKGVRINFSKTGASCTLGMPGLSVNVGKKGTYLNTGIPGTGLYNRTKIDGSSTNRSNTTSTDRFISQTINLKFEDDGTVTFYDGNDCMITEPSMIRKIKSTPQFKSERARIMGEIFNRTNSKTEEFITIHCLSPKVDTMLNFQSTLENLKPEVYKKEIFSIHEPSKEEITLLLQNEAKQNIKSFAFWTLKKKRNEYVNLNLDTRFIKAHDNWTNEKKNFEEKQNSIEEIKNNEYNEEYKMQRKALELAISGDSIFIENAIDEWMSTIRLPVDFLLQFEYSENDKTIYVDLDLPEIEDLPQEKAVLLANETVKKKSKTQIDLKNEYIKCVFGLSVFFASNFYNISPCIEYIIISGYTQRRDSKTGDVKDNYVYSIKFTRAPFEKSNLAKIDPYQFCMKFENRCNVTQTMLLKTIVPF